MSAETGDTGGIHGFISVYYWSFFIYTCILENDDDDVEMQVFVPSDCASPEQVNPS